MWEIVYEFFKAHIEITIFGAITLIQVAPIKINPWSWCGKILRKVIIGDIDAKLDDISQKVGKLEDTMNERDAILARTHILRFNDELYNGIKHSKEYFDQQLEDCDRYEQYCDSHPDFKNSRTVMATQNIKETYDKLMREHKFL